MQFTFADHTLDTARRELRRGTEAIAVEPQVLDLLICLVENRNRVVTKNDLIASVWNGRAVSEATLSSRIYAARKALGDTGQCQKLIRTIQRKGLRFVGEVQAQPDGLVPEQVQALPAEAASEEEDLSRIDKVRRFPFGLKTLV